MSKYNDPCSSLRKGQLNRLVDTIKDHNPKEVIEEEYAPKPISMIIMCSNTGKPLLYRKDKGGYFVACEDFPECSCAISLKGM